MKTPNTSRLVSVVLIAILIASPALPAQQQQMALDWTGAIAAGRPVAIRNVNGAIVVQRSTDGNVRVTAEKRWRRGDPSVVRIERVIQDGAVVVCALWRPGARCDRSGSVGGERRESWRNDNDVSVHFTLYVPDGVPVELVTVNGGITAADVSGSIEAQTVNGGITLRRTGGTIDAETTNGGITAEVDSVRGETVTLRTVNGGVTVMWPTTVGAQLDLRTVNGRASTEFNVAGVGVGRERQLRGTIGDGRVRLTAHAVNGGVSVKRSR